MKEYLLFDEIRARVPFLEQDFLELMKLFTHEHIKKDQHVYRAGDIVRFGSFVLEGCLKHYFYNEQGKESIAYFAEERWWAGDIVSLNKQQPTNMNLQAMEDCEVLGLTRHGFELAMENFSAFRAYHHKTIEEYFIKMQQQVGRSHTDSAEEKYLRLLKERPSLIKRLPLNQVAIYLGINQATLSRVRAKIARH